MSQLREPPNLYVDVVGRLIYHHPPLASPQAPQKPPKHLNALNLRLLLVRCQGRDRRAYGFDATTPPECFSRGIGVLMTGPMHSRTMVA